MSIRERFFEKIGDWILKSEKIRKRIFFVTKQINPRSLRSWCIKGTEESILEVVKKHKIHFRILSDLRIQSWIFLKKRTFRRARI